MKFKKIITWILIFLTLFNFLVGTVSCKATDEAKAEMEYLTNTPITGIALDGLIGVLTWVTRLKWLILPYAVQSVTSLVAYSEGVTDGWDFGVVTPAHILFNQINLTDINIFEMNPNGGRAIKTIRRNIRKWYYAMFVLAVILLLCILVYIGIRMAISTVAEKKAVYKKWLINWFASLILLFMLHFIIRGTIYLNSQLVKIFAKVDVAEMNNSILSFVTNVNNMLILKTLYPVATIGWSSLCVYICFVILTVMFLIMYIKRMLTISFLIIIAPLITITYSIDKLGDNKSQALDTWLKEFMYGVLIQPFHCLIYLVFVSQAIDLCSTGTLASMMLAIMMMFFIMKAEGIVRKIFGFEKASSAATGAMAGAALMTGVNGVKKMVGESKKIGAAATKLKDRTGGNPGGTGGTGGTGGSGGTGGTGGNNNSNRPQRTNGTRSQRPPIIDLNPGVKRRGKMGIINRADKWFNKLSKNINNKLDSHKFTKGLNKARTLKKKYTKKYLDNGKMQGGLFGAMVGGMTGQGVMAGATIGSGVGSVVQKKLEDRRNIRRGKQAIRDAYCNYQQSSGLSDEEMTTYTNELLNDPEQLEDMQKTQEETEAEWKARTQRSNEDDGQWRDRMNLAQAMYTTQCSYRKAGIDGDEANDKIGDTIAKLQHSSPDPKKKPPTP